MNGQYQDALHQQFAMGGGSSADDPTAAAVLMNGMPSGNLLGMNAAHGIPGLINGQSAGMSVSLMPGIPGMSTMGNISGMPGMLGMPNMAGVPTIANGQIQNMQNFQQVLQAMQGMQGMRNVIVGSQMMSMLPKQQMMLPSMNMGAIDISSLMQQNMGDSMMMPIQPGGTVMFSSHPSSSPPEYTMNPALKANISTQSLTDDLKVMQNHGHHLMSMNMGMDDDDDDGDGTDLIINENTGRWTREEHHLFLKGLELHGKGWKKIASLIKTRTVVQIRTHAQKYFLKLQKARQGGDGMGLLIEGKSLFGRKRRKRRLDKTLNVASHFKPFFGVPESEDAKVDVAEKDVDDGLYNFLSPTLDKVTENQQVKSMDSSTSLISTIKPPEWYQRGYHVEKLLQDAEVLDWNVDSGEAIDQPLFKRPSLAKEAGGKIRSKDGLPGSSHSDVDDNRPISPLFEGDPVVTKIASSAGWDTHISQECLSEFLGTLNNGGTTEALPNETAFVKAQN